MFISGVSSLITLSYMEEKVFNFLEVFPTNFMSVMSCICVYMYLNIMVMYIQM